MFKRLSHVMLYVRDMPRAVGWYCDKLGFEPIFVAGVHYASLRHKQMNCQIDLHPERPGESRIGCGAEPYFETADLDKSIVELRAKGINVGDALQAASGPRFTSFADSEGNSLGVFESAR